jgi:hypothetical protein
MPGLSGTVLEKTGGVRGLMTVAIVLWGAGGCSSLTEREVGPGQIPSVTISGRMGMPADAARSGVSDARWRDASGAELTVRAGEVGTMISAEKEIEFYSQAEATELAKRLGERAGAIERIDVDVREIALDPASHAEALLDGMAIGPHGFSGRVALPQATTERVVAAIRDGQPVTLAFGVALTCGPTDVALLPSVVQVRVLLQPILVVQPLEAL